MVWKWKKSRKYEYVDPDEIFMDSQNLAGFDTEHFEGTIEKPISKNSLSILSVTFLVIGLVFVGKLFYLQIYKGDEFFKKSANNSLNKIPLFAPRGVVFDRNQVPLVWNTTTETSDFLERNYIPKDGFAHLLGYVSYPIKDKSGNYWQQNMTGKDGIEKNYNNILEGKNGVRLIEVNAHDVVQSENTIEPVVNGANLTLSIDQRIQEQLYISLKQEIESGSFSGGGAVIMDITNGEVLALTNFPEYNSNVISRGEDGIAIKNYLNDKRKPFMNKVVSGLFAPGSIIKPFIAFAALEENVISPLKQILSTSSISIQNPYDKNLKTVFKDWKAHGYVDMRRAIAVSSDVYFYEVGGGYEDQKGIGIANIKKYTQEFGISQKTGIDLPLENSGVIPDPEWKASRFNGEGWRLGNTYHTAIGQYGFQVTPIEMLRAVSAIANNGTLVTPHVLKSATNGFDDSQLQNKKLPDYKLDNYQIVREGMRQAVTSGTLASLNNTYVTSAGKSGTAEIGANKDRVNSWVIGFYPYESPRYAFTILLESGPANNAVHAASTMKYMFEWMSIYAPEYLK